MIAHTSFRENEAMKKALILGCTGQDGSYLVDNLVVKGYKVHGMYRRSSTGNLDRIWNHLGRGTVILHKGDMLDFGSVRKIIGEVQPDLLFNMADQDNVDWSYKIPSYNADVTYNAVGNVLECLLSMEKEKRPRFFQPVSALMFGEGGPGSSDESRRIDPRNPYAIAKAAAYHLCRYYRCAHGLWVATGILFNHDSERRGNEYLLHRVCEQAAKIGLSQGRGNQKIKVGMLDMRVDIGYAPEYCEAMVRTLTVEEPGDYVIGSGRGYTILEIVTHALQHAGIQFPVEGKRVVSPEQALRFVECAESFNRPGQGNPWLVAYPHKAKQKLGWESTTHIPDLTRILVNHYKSRWEKFEFKPLRIEVRGEEMREEDVSN